jgi:hypothetical protein
LPKAPDTGELDAGVGREARSGARVLSELERLFLEPGCPSCRYLEEVERSFFSWFRIESFTTAEMQASLRAGMGMCPAHSRRLADDEAEGHVMTTVMRHALSGARQTLREAGQPGVCPACEASGFGAQRARGVLLDSLPMGDHARLYREHDGVCLRHFLSAAQVADRDVLGLLAQRLAASIEQQDGVALVRQLAGGDGDATARAAWRERLPEPPCDDSTVARLCRQLDVDACPVCLARGQADRRYARWFAAQVREGDPSLQNDPGELCAAHLHDVTVIDEAAAGFAARRQQAAKVGQFQQLLDRLDHLPAQPRRGRQGSNDDVRPALDALPDAVHCPACHAGEGIEQSQMDLIRASLGLRAVRDRYERSHGLCVRHALQVPDGEASRIIRRHLDARLAVLSWEVEETARKYAWAFRHEPGAPERDAWARALVQIDGRVFEGGAAE